MAAWLRVIQGQVTADPYPDYALLCAGSPLIANPYGPWIAGGWGVCSEILGDRRWGHDLAADASESGRTDWWEHAVLASDRHVMLRMNAEDHTRVRAPMARAFTARRVAALAERVETETGRLLDMLSPGEPVDVVDALALPLPITVIGELLGVPASDRAQFQAWTRTSILEPVFTDDELAAADAAVEAMWDYMRGLVEYRRRKPDTALISTLLRDGADAYSADELVGNLLLLFGAGFVTTVHLIGTLFALLGEHPEVIAMITAAELGAEAVVEEVLRFDAPVQMTGRRAMVDLDLAGIRIAAGDVVLLYLAAANRDPARFQDPQVLWPARSDGGSLAFGAGSHFCLGAALARIEGTTVVAQMTQRFSGWAVAEAVRQQTVPLRGYDQVTIVPGPRRV